MDNKTKPCIGFWGKIFGHEYRARYTKRESMPHKPNMEDVFLDKEVYVRSHIVHTSVYECDVCIRCGDRVQKEEQCKQSEKS